MHHFNTASRGRGETAATWGAAGAEKAQPPARCAFLLISPRAARHLPFLAPARPLENLHGPAGARPAGAAGAPSFAQGSVDGRGRQAPPPLLPNRPQSPGPTRLSANSSGSCAVTSPPSPKLCQWASSAEQHLLGSFKRPLGERLRGGGPRRWGRCSSRERGVGWAQPQHRCLSFLYGRTQDRLHAGISIPPPSYLRLGLTMLDKIF